MKDKFYVALYYLFYYLVKVLPIGFLSKWLATLAMLVGSKHKKIIRVNLNLAYHNPDKAFVQKIQKACFYNLFFTTLSFIKNQKITKQKVLSRICLKNEHYFEAVRDEKFILVTAHYGNWEFLPLVMATYFELELSVVGRALDVKAIDKVLRQNREKFNIKLLDKSGAMKTMMSDFKKGRTLGLLVDQNTASSEGVLVDFFGKKARHTPSVSLLARKFNAKIVPVFIKTVAPNRYEVEFFAPIAPIKSDNYEEDIQRLTQAQADATEAMIRSKPEEWFWCHKRWKNQYEESYK